MFGKRQQFCCLLFVFAIVCSETDSSAEPLSAEEQMGVWKEIVAVSTGTPPGAKVRQWFRLISLAPNPPGGPKVYSMETPARKPFFDGHTYDVQVTSMQYQSLFQAAQSPGCDHKMSPPKRNTKFPELPAIQLSVHAGGTTRDVCQITYAKVCAYLNSVENRPGADWSKNIHASLTMLRKASSC